MPRYTIEVLGLNGNILKNDQYHRGYLTTDNQGNPIVKHFTEIKDTSYIPFFDSMKDVGETIAKLPETAFHKTIYTIAKLDN